MVFATFSYFHMKIIHIIFGGVNLFFDSLNVSLQGSNPDKDMDSLILIFFWTCSIVQCSKMNTLRFGSSLLKLGEFIL
jgi:hypothetical protein